MRVVLLNLIVLCSLISCKQELKKDNKKSTSNIQVDKKQEFKNKGHQLVFKMTQKVGNYKTLLAKKDVVYTYSYTTPDGKSDVSTEKYMFKGELSYGAYKKHERTLENLSGLLEQGYNGSEFWLKQKGKEITDVAALKRVAFNRPTNFYWFTMMQKLLDPGLNYEYVKNETVNGTAYDIVKITFTANDNKPKDIYQVYINTKTKLIDQFLFTVMDFGVAEPFLMQMEYENIDGMLIPTKRKYKKSNWQAVVTDKPWVFVNWTNIKFNNNLTLADFKK